LGPSDEKCPAARPAVQTLEIHVPAVHDVEGPWFGRELVEHVDVVHSSRRNSNKCGDIAPQVQERVHLHRVLIRLVLGPRKQADAQVDDGRVQRVNGAVQIDGQALPGIKLARFPNENVSKVCINAPVAAFVGVAERAARDPAADAQVIQPSVERTQAGHDIAQALAIGQLREGHAEKMIPARKTARAVVASITGDALAELVNRKMLDELGENRSSGVHTRVS